MRQLIAEIFIFSFLGFASSAADKEYLTLEDVIERASQQSLDAFRYENMFLSSF